MDSYSGSANKNIGDAFLLVWKYRDSYYSKDSEGNLILKKNERVLNFSDFSLISFVKIQGCLFLSKKLYTYRSNPGLNARMPHYTVRMGYGLHTGWAIEGAIGSNFKIDASYLSPNVNMASRLEAATKQFGTMLLVSGELYDTLSYKS